MNRDEKKEILKKLSDSDLMDKKDIDPMYEKAVKSQDAIIKAVKQTIKDNMSSVKIALISLLEIL